MEFQREKIKWLEGKKHLTIKGPNIDLSLSIEGRKFIGSNGKYNFPDGEIYTSPVGHSVNGWVHFNYPAT